MRGIERSQTGNKINANGKTMFLRKRALLFVQFYRIECCKRVTRQVNYRLWRYYKQDIVKKRRICKVRIDSFLFQYLALQNTGNMECANFDTSVAALIRVEWISIMNDLPRCISKVFRRLASNSLHKINFVGSLNSSVGQMHYTFEL